MFTRKNVVGDVEWADHVLWYARGVRAMKAKPLAEPTSWRFFAGMHGFNPELWRQLGYFSTTDTEPSPALAAQFWQQCQHGSWYFLPWHRGYLLALEANVRAEVIAAGGPDDWALPYWNYFDPEQNALPSEFASTSWPDGPDDNPLFVEPRYGPNGDGDVYVDLNYVNLDALGDPDFTGVASGGSPGFGGVDTGFSHGGRVHGGVETQPHDYVHGLVGGAKDNDRQFPGAMAVPSSAGLDPIFYLHHANIDRLWAVWNAHSASHTNPDDATWSKGPASIGERAFQMPMPDGTTWTYTPEEMSDTQVLGYTYEELDPQQLPAPARTRRLFDESALGLEGVSAMAKPGDVEMVGANEQPLPVTGTEARSTIRMNTEGRRKITASLSDVAAADVGAADLATGGGASPPDRVFLNLENVRGLNDATVFHVYVGVPDDASEDDYPDRLAGSIALFGVREASDPDGEHAGEGLVYVLDISHIVDDMHLRDSFDVETLPVRIVPTNPVEEDAQVTIGRISIHRQSV